MVGSVCSGIGAPECGWSGLGWHSAFLSEIEPFPRSVLAQRFPGVPLHGDFTTIKAGDYESIDLLVGGTPCQSFSVAGLRGGLVDERGNLALEYLRLADRLRPRWLVWENVPGVLSSSGGRDFGAFLGGLGELGYGFAYRVLDAQHFGVAQRRRRVFVVGYLGDWRRAAAVLFEPASLRRHSAPRREAGQKPAPTISSRPTGGGGLGTDFDLDGGLISMCLNAKGGSGPLDAESETLIPISIALRGREGGGAIEVGDDKALTLRASTGGGDKPHVLAFHGSQDPDVSGDITHPVGRNQGRETCVAFAQNQRDELREMAIAGALAAQPGMKQQTYLMQAVAIQGTMIGRGDNAGPQGSGVSDVCFTLTKSDQHGVAHGSAVRRLTPTECERLQGFPDGWTAITHRKKPAADGPRYKALGNSMAVPVLTWIGKRIAMQELQHEMH
jgi:DNA (cytosine-5)-methyltransferase 1